MKSVRIRQSVAGILAALLVAQCGVLPIQAAEPTETYEQSVEVLADTAMPTAASANTIELEGKDGQVSITKKDLYEKLKEFYGEPEGATNAYRLTSSNNEIELKKLDSTLGYENITLYQGTYQVEKYVKTGTNIIGIPKYDYVKQELDLTVIVTERLTPVVTVNDNVSVAMPYNEDGTVDFDQLRESIFATAVESTTPALKYNEVTIEYYHKGITAIDSKWLPLEGQNVVGGIGYPAISEGTHQIKISWGGNEDYYGFSEEITVEITARPEAPYELNDPINGVKFTVDENMQVDYDALRTAIFNAVVKSSGVLSTDNVTIEYYYKGLTSVDSKWLPLEGQAVVGGLGYPAISAGTQTIRISYAGDATYAPTVIETEIQVSDRDQLQFNLNEGPYEVGLKFDAEQGYDYEATAEAIYNAIVASTVNPEGLTAKDVTVQYNVDKTGITDSFKPLNETDITGLVKFGVGDWEIRISWDGNQEYRGSYVDVNVTTTDNRIASEVVLNSGVSFTYNMDVNAMKQAIFDNAIDWTNSKLPAKETLSLDDFVIEYKAKLTDAETGMDVGLDDLEDLIGKIPGLGDLINNDTLSQYVPIEGKVYEIGGTVLGQFPQMGAGVDQQIRVSYVGNSEYRPSEYAEGTVTVNKAKVSVKVNSNNIYAGDELPADFITTDPADKFDFYTVYAGITSNVTTGIYLDLPERYTENSLIIKTIDTALEAIGQKTLTQMMQEGVTVGELRQLFNTQELLDLLEKLNIDTGTFGQIMNVINKLPGIMDGLRISFGTPNRAGLYTVVAVSDSKNYETGVGMGFLLVRMRLSGSKLTWNQEISGGKLTAEQAKTFDFGATLSYNGDVTVDQGSVHYLYSGFTSKWRVYSSTTTPPTEPGRYVVTVCVLGGSYLAAPITRSFQITK